MLMLFAAIWLIDRCLWIHTKTIGQYEDRQGDLDFISKYSQANGPRINVERLRKLATAGSSLRLFEGRLDLELSRVYTVLSSIG